MSTPQWNDPHQQPLPPPSGYPVAPPNAQVPPDRKSVV